jgi:hypothetical protein
MSTLPGPEHQAFGDFEVRSLLGEGGTAIVYHAVNTLVGADVALKILRDRLSEDQRRRFLAECRAQWELAGHPQIVRLYWAGAPDDGPAWLAVQLYETSLAQRLGEEPPLTVPQILQIADDLLTGLAAVHHAGLIHRDVKPGNVMLDNGRAALGDFGLAMLVEDWTRDAGAGTARFIAPEVAAGAPPSRRSDVYAAAITIRSMFTGPVPAPIDAVLTRAASFAQLDRPADAWALLGALRAARAGQRGTPAASAGPGRPEALTESLASELATSPGPGPGMHTDPGHPIEPGVSGPGGSAGPPRAKSAARYRPLGLALAALATAGMGFVAGAAVSGRTGDRAEGADAAQGSGASIPAGSSTTGSSTTGSAGSATTGTAGSATTRPVTVSTGTIATSAPGVGEVTVVFNACSAEAGVLIEPRFVSSPGKQVTSGGLLQQGSDRVFSVPAGRYTLSIYAEAQRGENARPVGYVDVTVRSGERSAINTSTICGASGVQITHDSTR